MVATRWDASVLAVATTVAAVAVVWGDRDVWPYVWSETDAMVGRALFMVLPVVVATSAHLAGVRARSGIEQLTAGPTGMLRSSRRRMAAELACVAGVAVSAVAAVMWGLTATRATYGAPQIMALAPVIAWAMVGCLAGVLLGSRWPLRWLPLVLGFGTYVLVGLVIFRFSHPPAVSAHPFDYRSMTFFTSPWWAYLLQAAIPLGVILWTSSGARWWGATLTSVALAACFVVTDLERAPNPVAARQACREHGPVEVCMPVAKDYAGATVADSYLSAVRVAPVRSTEVVLVDDEAGPVTSTGAQRAEDHRATIRLSTVGLELSAQSTPDLRVMQAMWVRVLLRPTGGGADRGATWVVERQAMRDLGLPTDGSLYPGAAAYDALVPSAQAADVARIWEKRGAAERRAWLARHAAQWRRGDVTLADLR